jgi:hypothetical protein
MREASVTDTVPRNAAATVSVTSPAPLPPSREDVPADARSRLGDLATAGWRRVLGWPCWVQVLVAYGASRVLCGVIIELAARWGQNPAGVGVLSPHYLDMVQIWDGEWFKRIALHGYPSTLPHGAVGTVDYNSWAFFPVFPMLVRLVMTTGMSFSVAASVVNLLAGAGAALMIWRLFSVRPGHDRLAVLAVAFWCVLPSAPVLQVAYTEALAALLLAATMLLTVRRHYLWAVPVVLLLGLTRAIAAPLVVVVLCHGWLRWRSRARDPWSRSQVVGWLALLLATGISAVLWPAIVGLATNVPDGFLQTQAAWGQRPADGPFLPWLTWAWAGLGLVGVVLLIAVVVAGGWLLTSRHTAWLATELRVFGVVYPVYLLAVVRPITSMWRFLLLDLPIAAALASVAARGAREHVSREWRWRVAAAGVVALAAMCWWTAVLLTRIPWGDSPP